MNPLTIKYFPKNSIIHVNNLLDKYPIEINFVNPRNSKKGTFVVINRKPKKITLNNNLCQDEMLLVFLHEMAHYINYMQYKTMVKPHGKEFQNTVLMLIQQFIYNQSFSSKTASILMKNFFSKAPKYKSHCLELFKHFHPGIREISYLYQLDDNEKFTIVKRPNISFILLKKKRTQYICKNLNNDKLYRVHYFAEILKLYE